MAWQYALAAAQWLTQVSAQKSAEEAQIEAAKKTAKGYIQQANWTWQNNEIARQQAFDAAINDLIKVRRQGAKLEASTQAAVNEDLMGGGRTASAIVRSVRNDEARAASSVHSNWNAKNQEINLNNISTLVSLRNAIDSIPEVQRKSNFGYLLDGAKLYFGAKAAVDAGKSIYDDAKPSIDYTANYSKESHFNLFNPEGVFNSSPLQTYLDGQAGANTAFDSYNGVSSSFDKGGLSLWQRKLVLP